MTDCAASMIACVIPLYPLKEGGGSVASLHRRDARAATITRVLFVS
jgi:hypothetical protein